ncbi:MAG: prolyl oligopeptidase family serine peptidase [Bdellovibrio sp.]
MKSKARVLILILLFAANSSYARPGGEQQPRPAPLPPPPQPPLAAPLSSYNIDPAGITISGVSSGGYMAVQMQVAFSKTFAGAGSVAGGVFWCAEGSSARAQKECMNHPQGINSEVQINKAQELAKTGSIDPLSNLKNHKIYLYASPKDSVIHPGNSEKLIEFYNAFTSPNNIVYESSIDSAHGFPTLNSGVRCQFAMLPWILKCNFDTAGEMLNHLYGSLSARGAMIDSHLSKFSQKDFGGPATPLYKEGWIYVPKFCSDGGVCKLHMALHGCQMNPSYIQDKFATLGGYNEWAEANNIIVLYPQSEKIPGDNPYACWDWFGFTGADYVTQSGSQMKALYHMILKVQGKEVRSEQ